MIDSWDKVEGFSSIKSIHSRDFSQQLDVAVEGIHASSGEARPLWEM